MLIELSLRVLPIVFWGVPILCVVCFYTGRRSWRIGAYLAGWAFSSALFVVLGLAYGHGIPPPWVEWVGVAIIAVQTALFVMLCLEFRRTPQNTKT